jgi:hypothetical protein
MMASFTNYNFLAKKMMSRRTKPYPVNEYNFKSNKYKYVYNISIDGIVFWHAHLDLFGITWDDDFYSNTEEGAAFWIYKQIKKYLKTITRNDKKHDNKHYRKHINWQTWLLNYQYHQYPKRICELKIY